MSDRPARQGCLLFLESTRRRDRRFQAAISVLTALVLVGMIGGSTAGRAALTALADRASRAARGWLAPAVSRRAARAARWRRRRTQGIALTDRIYREVFSEADPPIRHLLELAGMAPGEALLRWGNYDRTLLLSPRVFEPDDDGRSYRLRPETRSLWLRRLSLPRGLTGFFLVPDTPEVRRAGADAGAIVMPESVQTTNAWGCRGPEPDLAARWRVLVLGDSFMQGLFLGDAETPPACLERALRRRWKAPVTVLNTGHLGYSTEQYAATLHAFADRFRPQVVVVSLCINDFGDAGAVTGGCGDWDEARTWLGEIADLCRARRAVCLAVPVPLEDQITGRRKAGSFPGPLPELCRAVGIRYCDPIEDFVDEHLRLLAERVRHGDLRRSSPLFNGHIDDGHFSAAGAEVWAEVVARRLALLVWPVGVRQPPVAFGPGSLRGRR